MLLQRPRAADQPKFVIRGLAVGIERAAALLVQDGREFGQFVAQAASCSCSASAFSASAKITSRAFSSFGLSDSISASNCSSCASKSGCSASVEIEFNCASNISIPQFFDFLSGRNRERSHFLIKNYVRH